MKLNKVIVTYKRTVQMRQFEPVEVSMMLDIQMDPTDKYTTVFANAKAMVRNEVEEEVQRLKRERKESYDSEMEKTN